MKEKFKRAYMDVAARFAELSYARRLHVGAVIVKNDSIISFGYNGTPAGWDNNCEDVVMHSDETVSLKTKPEVLHAERNALDKLANHGGLGSNGAAMFVTHSPCLECAKSIYGAGIKELYYKHSYHSQDGIAFLQKCGILVEKIITPNSQS
jgi:dCMP deaminase